MLRRLRNSRVIIIIIAIIHETLNSLLKRHISNVSIRRCFPYTLSIFQLHRYVAIHQTRALEAWIL